MTQSATNPPNESMSNPAAAGSVNTGTGGVNGRTNAEIRTGQPGVAESHGTTATGGIYSTPTDAATGADATAPNNGRGGVEGRTR